MPGDQVIQAVQQGIANGGGQSPLGAFLGQSAGDVRIRGASPSQARRPDPNGTIKIYGLDEGKPSTRT